MRYYPNSHQLGFHLTDTGNIDLDGYVPNYTNPLKFRVYQEQSSYNPYAAIQESTVSKLLAIEMAFALCLLILVGRIVSAARQRKYSQTDPSARRRRLYITTQCPECGYDPKKFDPRKIDPKQVA